MINQCRCAEGIATAAKYFRIANSEDLHWKNCTGEAKTFEEGTSRWNLDTNYSSGSVQLTIKSKVGCLFTVFIDIHCFYSVWMRVISMQKNYTFGA